MTTSPRMEAVSTASGPELGPDSCVRGPDGRVLCCVVLLATLYTEEGDRPEIRQGLVDTYERYLKAAGPRLVWGADPMTTDPVKLADTTVGDVRNWPREIFDRFDFQMLFTGAERVDSASPYSLVAVSRCREEGQLSFLSVTLPADWQRDKPEGAFAAFVMDLCGLVDPSHGYAGLGVVPHVTGLDTESVRPTFELARRFPGLELDIPGEHVGYLESRRRIKGVNWLTMLGKRWIDELGGEPALRSKLGQSIVWRPYAGGVVLQAGPQPSMGESGVLPDYRQVARALAPVRMTDPMMMMLPEAGFDRDEAQGWMSRFD